uniref:Thioesterase domain-containing protein n=1 Tax=Oryza meridionalis TaxID=40149 RepID=A0A0E0BZG2_9ORYZ
MDGESPAAAALRLAPVARRWLENPRESLARSREEGCGDAFNMVVMPGFRVSLAEPGRLVCSFRVPATVAVRASSFLSRQSCRSPRRVRSHSDSVSPACSWFLLLRRRAAAQDADGRWHAGAMAAAVDNLCAAVAYTADGVHRFTINQAMSFFSPAEHGEEVEMDGRVAHRKGKLTAAVVEVRRKASGELVAIGRQWMTSTRARPEKNGESRSKL